MFVSLFSVKLQSLAQKTLTKLLRIKTSRSVQVNTFFFFKDVNCGRWFISMGEHRRPAGRVRPAALCCTPLPPHSPVCLHCSYPIKAERPKKTLYFARFIEILKSSKLCKRFRRRVVTKHSFLCVPVKCLMISVSHLTARIPLNWRWQAETGSYTSNLITFFK